jgi:hypothetical protein
MKRWRNPGLRTGNRKRSLPMMSEPEKRNRKAPGRGGRRERTDGQSSARASERRIERMLFPAVIGLRDGIANAMRISSGRSARHAGENAGDPQGPPVKEPAEVGTGSNAGPHFAMGVVRRVTNRRNSARRNSLRPNSVGPSPVRAKFSQAKARQAHFNQANLPRDHAWSPPSREASSGQAIRS